MRVIACFKVVEDDQDVQVAKDGSLDFSKAHQTISEYDLNAIEIAVQLAAQDGTAEGVSVGPKRIDDSKTKKNALARGLSALHMVANDELDRADAFQTAGAISGVVGSIGDFDLIVCGDGSADDYAQQVDVQLACKLGLPVVNAVSKIEAGEGFITATRVLEDAIEVVEVPTPCVVSVVPDVAIPRIPGMKDILAAGKKPMNVSADCEIEASSIETVSCSALRQTDRGLEVLDASIDGSIAAFANALKSSM